MIWRVIANVAWVLMIAVLIPVAVLAGVLVGMTALMIPAVRWVAEQADGRVDDV